VRLRRKAANNRVHHSIVGGGLSPSVNGNRGRENNFTLDGVLNNAIFTDVWAISPPPDAIQEFNVQSHITDAQFSISSGANINVVTKSGTNQFHGAVWEFLRTTIWIPRISLTTISMRPSRLSGRTSLAYIWAALW